MSPDLFGNPDPVPARGGGSLGDARGDSAPLAVRMRPPTRDELVGQQHLLGPGAPLRRLVAGQPMSVFLWGPPGVGKTTLASIVSRASGARFVELSAVTAGVKELRGELDAARRELERGRSTVLFIDEVHRFSKTQQDALLPAVENRIVTLIAATTENPSFSVISPLLSRSLLLRLQPLTDADITGLISAALGETRITTEVLSHAVDRATVRYDRDGDQHYDVISAFIKSIRGSDVDAALHYLARMLEAGEDPRFIARRLMISASEDVGMAASGVLSTCVAAAQAVQLLGMPEARITLAHATVAAASAPKSNAAYMALERALTDVRNGRGGAVPAHLRDSHYSGAKALGHGEGYVYPHDLPSGVAPQQYLPDDLAQASYYQPTGHGAEAAISERLASVRKLLGR